MILMLSIIGIVIDLLQPSTLFDVIVSGLAKSSLYIMITAGLTIVFGLMGVLNFAHGSLTMYCSYVGGLVMILLVSDGSGTVMRFAAFFIAVVVVFGVMGMVGGALETTLVRRLYDRPVIYQVLLLFGVVLVLEEIARINVSLQGGQPTDVWQAALATKPNLLDSTYTIGPTRIWGLAVFEILIGLLTVAGVWLFLTRTKYGLIIRAGSEDSEMTEALGIDVRRVFTVVFAVGTGIAGVAGLLLAWDPRFGATIPLGIETLLIAFIVVVIGGLGTFRGTVYAGVLVGLIDALMTWLFQNHVKFPGLPEVVLFLVLVGVLAVRPRGLFGVAEVGDH